MTSPSRPHLTLQGTPSKCRGRWKRSGWSGACCLSVNLGTWQAEAMVRTVCVCYSRAEVHLASSQGQDPNRVAPGLHTSTALCGEVMREGTAEARLRGPCQAAGQTLTAQEPHPRQPLEIRVKHLSKQHLPVPPLPATHMSLNAQGDSAPK